MNPCRDCIGGVLVLVAVFVFGRSDLWNNAAQPKLKAMFIPGFDKNACVVVLCNGRVQNVFSDNQARAFADKLDTSQHALRWDLYNAADEYVAFKRRISKGDQQRSKVMSITQNVNEVAFGPRRQSFNDMSATARIASKESGDFPHAHSVKPTPVNHTSHDHRNGNVLNPGDRSFLVKQWGP
jgi:hypothetical protein